MTGNTHFDACRMFKHACAFVGCAKFCEKEPWNIEKRLPDYTVADIVNSAFACEIFLKTKPSIAPISVAPPAPRAVKSTRSIIFFSKYIIIHSNYITIISFFQ